MGKHVPKLHKTQAPTTLETGLVLLSLIKNKTLNSYQYRLIHPYHTDQLARLKDDLWLESVNITICHGHNIDVCSFLKI